MNDIASPDVRKQAVLARTLTPFGVWAIALGAVVGFGCFILPGIWLAQAGPAGTVLGLFLGGMMMLPIGKSFGTMILAFPVSGGPFAYAYYAFGRNHAFICGWMLCLGYLAIVALNASALPILFQFVLPGFYQETAWYTVAGSEVRGLDICISSAALLLFACLNYRGSRMVGRLQMGMVAVLLFAVLLMGFAAFVLPEVELANLRPLFAEAKRPAFCVLSILAVAPWAYVGFDTVPHASEEFSFSPNKAVTLIFLAILSGTVAYIIVTTATAVVFPWTELISADQVWPTGTVLHVKAGASGMLLLFLGVVMAIFTGINGFFLTASRLLYAMARVKALPAMFEFIHPAHKTPTGTLLFTLLISLIAPWFGRNVISWIVEMSSVGIAVGYAYTSIAALKWVMKSGEKRKDLWVHSLSVLFSLIFIVLLCLPGTPTFISLPSWVALFFWILIGCLFYSLQGRAFRRMERREFENLLLKKTLTRGEI